MVKEVVVVDEVDDGFEVDEDEYDFEEVGNQVTTTDNFMGGPPALEGGVEDLGVVTVQPDAEVYTVRVIEDVGPVFYGSELIELKKNRLYRVQDYIYEYLKTRDLLWEQQ